MNGAQIQFVGNLVRDPEELRYTTKDGIPYITVTVAVNTYNGSSQEPDTEFYNITAWRRQAENILNRCRKGQSLLVSGQLAIRRYWKNNNEPGLALDVNARDVHHRFTTRPPTQADANTAEENMDAAGGQEPEEPDMSLQGHDEEEVQPLDLSPTA